MENDNISEKILPSLKYLLEINITTICVIAIVPVCLVVAFVNNRSFLACCFYIFLLVSVGIIAFKCIKEVIKCKKDIIHIKNNTFNVISGTVVKTKKYIWMIQRSKRIDYSHIIKQALCGTNIELFVADHTKHDNVLPATSKVYTFYYVPNTKIAYCPELDKK